eukprot:2133559-Pyramimonas_sp.AAC.1
MYNGPGSDLGLHAAESNTFLEFVVQHILIKYGHNLRPALLNTVTTIGAALVSILTLIRQNRWSFTDDKIREFKSHVVVVSKMWCTLDSLGPWRPKHHQLQEMADRTVRARTKHRRYLFERQLWFATVCAFLQHVRG